MFILFTIDLKNIKPIYCYTNLWTRLNFFQFVEKLPFSACFCLSWFRSYFRKRQKDIKTSKFRSNPKSLNESCLLNLLILISFDFFNSVWFIWVLARLGISYHFWCKFTVLDFFCITLINRRIIHKHLDINE